MPQPIMSACAPALAKLRSLRDLSLFFGKDYAPGYFVQRCSCSLVDAVDALAPLTGLAHLSVCLPRPAFVPAALGQLKGLRFLEFMDLRGPCVLEAGCFDLPNLQSLGFEDCDVQVEHAGALLSLTALQSLTHIEFSGGRGPPFVAGLVQLPRLQHLVFETLEPDEDECTGRSPELFRLPTDARPPSSALLHLDISGHGFAEFPLDLQQLAALECLMATGNGFGELPAAITALSRLTELSLGALITGRTLCSYT